MLYQNQQQIVGQLRQGDWVPAARHTLTPGVYRQISDVINGAVGPARGCGWFMHGLLKLTARRPGGARQPPRAAALKHLTNSYRLIPL
jgi:hypothetical protein